MRTAMQEAIRSYTLADGRRLKVYADEDPRDPREDDNVGKLCIRKHRNYTFPNELKFDFDSDYDGENVEDRLKELEKTHYLFWLDMYEHSGIVFSFSGKGMNCRFDTSNDCGFIAVPMGTDKITGHICTGYEDALSVAKNELKYWNAYCTGDVYGYVIEHKERRVNEKGEEKFEWEHDDSCRGYYELDDILDEVKDLSPNEID